jgi:Uma2 family endonuclease
MKRPVFKGDAMTKITEMTLFDYAIRVDEEIGARLEMVGGLPVWEAHPALRHQSVLFKIQMSIQNSGKVNGGCGCFQYADIYIQFPDGSLKRPDISIFCREPDEQDTAVTLVPEAVIEILSPGYEAKDTQVGVPFYLAQGVKDIVLFDPRSGEVTHVRADGEQKHVSPVTLTLECGCVCTV